MTTWSQDLEPGRPSDPRRTLGPDCTRDLRGGARGHTDLAPGLLLCGCGPGPWASPVPHDGVALRPGPHRQRPSWSASSGRKSLALLSLCRDAGPGFCPGSCLSVTSSAAILAETPGAGRARRSILQEQVTPLKVSEQTAGRDPESRQMRQERGRRVLCRENKWSGHRWVGRPGTFPAL